MTQNTNFLSNLVTGIVQKERFFFEKLKDVTNHLVKAKCFNHISDGFQMETSQQPKLQSPRKRIFSNPNFPRKPVPALDYFVLSVKDEIKTELILTAKRKRSSSLASEEENKDEMIRPSYLEIRAVARERWKAMSVLEKEPFQNAHEADKERYFLEIDAKQIPRKPSSAFFMYAQKVYAEIAKCHPAATPQEIMSIIGRNWRSMTQEQKEPYRTLEVRRRLAYFQTVKRLTPEAKATVEQRTRYVSAKRAEKFKKKVLSQTALTGLNRRQIDKQRSDHQMPRPPCAPFIRFQREWTRKYPPKSEKRHEISEKVGTWKWGQYFSKLWSSMSAEEREPYRKAFYADLERYQAAIEDWKKDMNRKHLGDLANALSMKLYTVQTPFERRRTANKQEQQIENLRKALKDST